MPRRINNESSRYADWSTAKLKKFAEDYHETVHGPNACCGVRDVIHLVGAETELMKRGYCPVAGPVKYVKITKEK